MPLPSFTISQVPKFSEILGDVVAGELSPRRMVNARILFRCNVSVDDFVLWEGEFERIRTIEAYVNTAGSIERKYDDGSLGPVKLLANDAGLNVTGIQWTIEVWVAKKRITSWTFNAEPDGATLNLATVAPTPAMPPNGVTRGPRGWRTRALPVDPDDPDTLYQYYDETGDEVGAPVELSELVNVAWGTVSDKPVVIGAGASQSEAREAIGAVGSQYSGGVGDGVTNDRAAIAAADAAASTAGLPLLLKKGTYRVSTNLTVTNPVQLQPGAVIKPDSGVTVTLAGGVQAPLQQVFDHSAGGKVVPLKVPFYHPAWWGPVNSANDSQSWIDMQAAITASASTLYSGAVFGQRVMAPAGINRIIGVTLSNCDLYASRANTAFVPPDGTTSGVMLTMGSFVTVHGGWFGTSESAQAVTCIHMQGYRLQLNGVYVGNQAANSVGIQMGTSGEDTTSPIIHNVIVRGGLSTPNAGTIGIDVQSADMEASNVWVAQHNIGIRGQFGGAGRWTNVHVWGNNTGIGGGNWDAHQFTNVYIDNNRGWGIDITAMDRANWDGVYIWQNGHSIASTGGMKLSRPSGSAQFSTFRGVVLNDNTGHGMYIDGVTDYEISYVLSSGAVQAGGSGAVVTTRGVEITSGTTRLRLKPRGSAASAVTPLIDNSTTTIYDANQWQVDAHAAASKTTPVDADEIPLVDSQASNGPKKLTIANLKAWIRSLLSGDGYRPGKQVVASSNVVKNASTGMTDFMSLTTTAGKKYLIRGAIVVEGASAADCKIRLQATSHTSPSGWFALTAPIATSATSTTSLAMTPDNQASIAASGGAAVSAGVIGTVRNVIAFTGYLVAGTGSSQSLDCQVAQNTSDATDTTFYAGSWMELVEIP